jgi:flavin-binding protein dodecin/nucleotide-binding universal stress UspA family protein
MTVIEPTYRVIRLVSTSLDSWEQAARNGVAEAAKTITNLRSALVTDLDVTLRNGEPPIYRIELEIAFQVDRARPNPLPGGPDVEVIRYLIVANETLEGNEVSRLVRDRIGAGPAEFHVLVPATRSRETRRLTAVTGDPLTGYAVVDVIGLEEAIARDRADAEARLATFTRWLTEVGADFTSELGGPDVFDVIAQVMARSSFDEIIISTLPSSVSRWLHLDLPSRVRRTYPLPVVVVTADPGPT